MVRSWAVIFLAVLGVVPIVLVGGLYEIVRRLDRGNLVPDRGRWIAAVAVSVAIGLTLVFVITRSA